MQIHLITTAPIIKRLSLNELIYSLGPRFSVRCPYMRESVLVRFFLEKIYENFARTLETVHNMELCVLERCPYREVRL